MDNTRTIEIPFDLAKYTVWQRNLVNRYHTNAIIKAIDTWLVLKSETRSGLIQEWNDQKQYLFTICKCKETVFRCRLTLLKDLKLLQYDRKAIRICSWEDLGTALQCNTDERFNISYDISNSQKLQEWLIATEILDNKNRQAYKIVQKVNHNPLTRQRLVNAVLKAGAEKSKLIDADYFLAWLKMLYWQDFVEVSDVHDLLIKIRPDNNRGVRGISKAWSRLGKTDEENSKEVLRNVSRVMYWKKKLVKNKIASVTNMQIESTTRTRNKDCHVLWLPSCKNSPRKDVFQTLLCLCDDIDIMQPWLRSNYIKTIQDNEDFPL